jgi:hypothetical protein
MCPASTALASNPARTQPDGSSSSFALFGIEAHGFWTHREDVEPRFFVLASYAAGEEPGELMYQTSLALNRQS